MKSVACVFGTRPEIIKLAPVLRALESRRDRIELLRIASSQHTDLLHPFARHFGVQIDHDLGVMSADQTPAEVAARVLDALDPILERRAPDLLLVQGDTTTALAAAQAGFARKIPVGHVEAGLRSGNPDSPFPEEMNRRQISKLAALHFAATPHNVDTLRSEGVDESAIVLTGNPVVDALRRCRDEDSPSPELAERLRAVREPRLVVLTTHRRESFGETMRENLEVLRDFVRAHDDVALAFPVHPNPEVAKPTQAVLADTERVHLLAPLGYPDFVHLLSRAWLIVSDSGGVQEEAPSLGKALLVLRENTERPEAIEAGVARLVGGSPARLGELLDELYRDDAWIRSVTEIANPFGGGDAGVRIADAVESFLAAPEPSA